MPIGEGSGGRVATDLVKEKGHGTSHRHHEFAESTFNTDTESDAHFSKGLSPGLQLTIEPQLFDLPSSGIETGSRPDCCTKSSR